MLHVNQVTFFVGASMSKREADKLESYFCGCWVFGDTGNVCASKNHKQSDSKID